MLVAVSGSCEDLLIVSTQQGPRAAFELLLPVWRTRLLRCFALLLVIARVRFCNVHCTISTQRKPACLAASYLHSYDGNFKRGPVRCFFKVRTGFPASLSPPLSLPASPVKYHSAAVGLQPSQRFRRRCCCVHTDIWLSTMYGSRIARAQGSNRQLSFLCIARMIFIFYRRPLGSFSALFAFNTAVAFSVSCFAHVSSLT